MGDGRRYNCKDQKTEIEEIEWRLRMCVKSTLTVLEESLSRSKEKELELLDEQTANQAPPYEECVQQEEVKLETKEETYENLLQKNAELQVLVSTLKSSIISQVQAVKPKEEYIEDANDRSLYDESPTVQRGSFRSF